MAALESIQLRRLLTKTYPWIKSPFIVGAPMRVLAGPTMAVAISQSGGLGFIGPQIKADNIYIDLEKATELIQATPETSPIRGSHPLLPIGVGFQTWNDDLQHSLPAIQKHRPCAVWLFAPRDGQKELSEWSKSIRQVSPGTQIWVQVGTLSEARDAATSADAPDVLVIQGAEAGGHGRAKDGLGTMALVPEVADALQKSGIPIIAAGGIIDGRGVAAALSLGASGAAMGTRLLASTQARISKGYQDEVVRASDGASSTVRTQLYNHLRGTFGWPEQFAPRTIINKSWVDHEAGTPFEKLQELHDDSAKTGDAGWGPEGRLATYAGAAVGLVRSVDDAAAIISNARDEARRILRALADDE